MYDSLIFNIFDIHTKLNIFDDNNNQDCKKIIHNLKLPYNRKLQTFPHFFLQQHHLVVIPVSSHDKHEVAFV